ncbi:MAG: hypothetical protein HKN09_05415, partial [Saprospiraceae bacterium]|nr:hypothetical protein [Saprospiraceae bacterium]
QMDESIAELSGVLVTFNSRFQDLFTNINSYQELSGLASINRFIYAYSEFLRIIQSQGKPLVISLQNYQFADVGTNKLLEQVMKSSIIKNILVLLTYERDEQDEFISIRNHLDNLLQNKDVSKGEYELKNFNEDEVISILGQLKIEPRDAFGALIHKKTKGSPSFIKQLFEELISSQQIKANSAKQIWEVDLDSVENVNLSENVFQFLSNRLNHLSKEEIDLLKHASVIGHQFKLNELKKLIDLSDNECDEIINNLRTKGFLNPVAYQQANLSELKFSHPGFIDTFSKIISKDEFNDIKLKIIKHNYLSLKEEQLNAKIYELVNHILSLPAEKCLPFKDLLLKAAAKAKNEAAFANASRYFLLISKIEQLEHGNSEDYYNFYFESTSCALSALRYETYQHQLRELESIASKGNQTFRIYLLKAMETIQRGNLRGTIDNLESGLKNMGLKFSKQITQFQIIKIFMKSVFKSRNLKPETVESIPFSTNEKLNIAHQLINISSPAIYFLEPKLSSRLTWLGIKDTVEKGLLMESPSSLLALGFTINSFSDMVDRSVIISKAGLKLLENKIKDKSISVACHFLYSAFVQHLIEPLDAAIEDLDDNYKRGREAGNTHMAFYSLGMNRWYNFFNGIPLQKLSEHIEASHVLSKDANQIIIDYYHRIIAAIIQELTRGSFLDTSMEDNTLPINTASLKKGPFAKDRIINCNVNMGKLIIDAGRGVVCYDEEVFQQLLLNLKEGGIGPYNAVVQILYMTFHVIKGEEKLECCKLKDLKKFIKSIKVRAEYCASNYATKYYLIEALTFQYEGKLDEAFGAFNKAHIHALDNDNPWDSALVCEEFGLFLINQNQKHAGLNMLAQSMNYYQAWGATSVVNRLKSEYPEIASEYATTKVSNIEAFENESSLTKNQIHEIINVSTGVLGAPDLKNQLDILIGSALKFSNATVGKFVIIDEDRYQLFASKGQGQNINLIEEAERLEEEIPLSILRLISRRKNSLILSDINTNPQLKRDPYVQNHGLQTAILIPIVKNKEVKSILLLENSQTKEDDIELHFLEKLCSQVGLAIDNSILTELLEEKLEERAKQIQEERDKSEQLIRNILPEAVAQELKVHGKIKARKFESVSVLFTDFKDFSKFSESLNAEQIIEEIDSCYKAFDAIVEKYNIEKIKTIGDAYMCAGGIPSPRDNHEIDIVNAALEMIQFISDSNADRIARGIPPLEVRAGIHTGPVIAGIVGSKKYAYDIWGPTVNIAARMESSGEPGKLNISGATYLKIKDKFTCEFRGQIKAKSVGAVDMYFVES